MPPKDSTGKGAEGEDVRRDRHWGRLVRCAVMAGDQEESHKERVDRELIELLNELRVALPGVQVLFAFLLIVPFSQLFASASDPQRSLYFVALVAAAIASGLLIAPAAQHRILFRKHDKEALLKRANGLAIAGNGALAVSICASVVLAVDFLFGSSRSLPTGGAIAVLLLWLWFVQPLMRRGNAEADGDDPRALGR